MLTPQIPDGSDFKEYLSKATDGLSALTMAALDKSFSLISSASGGLLNFGGGLVTGGAAFDTGKTNLGDFDRSSGPSAGAAAVGLSATPTLGKAQVPTMEETMEKVAGVLPESVKQAVASAMSPDLARELKNTAQNISTDQLSELSPSMGFGKARGVAAGVGV